MQRKNKMKLRQRRTIKNNAVSLPVFDGLDTAKFHDDLAENLARDWKCARQRECPTQFQTTSATLSAESECRLCWQNKTCPKLSKI